jgi:hypothetical protein
LLNGIQAANFSFSTKHSKYSLVIASEAKQSRAVCEGPGLPRRLRLLAMTKRVMERSRLAFAGLGIPRLTDYSSPMQTPDDRPIYRLLTGKDDRAFCERVSEALAQGWRLYGSPTMTYDGGMDCIKVAQAVVWHEADVVK